MATSSWHCRRSRTSRLEVDCLRNSAGAVQSAAASLGQGLPVAGWAHAVGGHVRDVQRAHGARRRDRTTRTDAPPAPNRARQPRASTVRQRPDAGHDQEDMFWLSGDALDYGSRWIDNENDAHDGGSRGGRLTDSLPRILPFAKHPGGQRFVGAGLGLIVAIASGSCQTWLASSRRGRSRHSLQLRCARSSPMGPAQPRIRTHPTHRGRAPATARPRTTGRQWSLLASGKRPPIGSPTWV